MEYSCYWTLSPNTIEIGAVIELPAPLQDTFCKLGYSSTLACMDNNLFLDMMKSMRDLDKIW